MNEWNYNEAWKISATNQSTITALRGLLRVTKEREEVFIKKKKAPTPLKNEGDL